MQVEDCLDRNNEKKCNFFSLLVIFLYSLTIFSKLTAYLNGLVSDAYPDFKFPKSEHVSKPRNLTV